MPITYYPNETFKMRTHVIDQLQKPEGLYSVFGVQDLAVAPLSLGVWCPQGWEVRRVSLNFTNAAAKDYSISVSRGIGIASGKNDRLWIKVDTVSSQQVIIPQGFYTGTAMASALITALNLMPFPAASKPFNVTYVDSSGLFSIIPAAGNAQLQVTNSSISVRRSSTVAPVIGFTANTNMTTPLVSDNPVKALNKQFVYLSATASTALNVLSTDVVAMTIDNQLTIQASSVNACLATYEVVYKTLDI